MSDCTRRTFLAGVAGLWTAPLLLSACNGRKSSPPPPTTARPAPPARVNLDEVVEEVKARPPLPRTEPIMRVRVARLRHVPARIRIGAQDQWLRAQRLGAPGRGTALIGPVTVNIDQRGWSLTDARGFRAPIEGWDEFTVAAGDHEDITVDMGEPTIAAKGPNAFPRFPGAIRFVYRPDQAAAAEASASSPSTSPSPASAFDIINDVPMERYLPGVLMGELYRTWHVQTFAAQAVAARSFAATEAAVFAGRRHYDVTNTAASQMYLGAVNERDGAKAREAVELTRGLVLGYDGLLVSGYYSSCCGGVAATATDVIGSNPINDVEALRGRPQPDVCTSAPVYQWSVEYPLDQLTARMIAWGKDRKIKELAEFSKLEAIDVVARNPHGRPTRMRLTDDKQNVAELSAENFRRAANFSTPTLPPLEKPLRSSNLKAVFKRDTVALEGFGFGHGVGLCQWGAEILAKQGKQFHEILQWYYPGVELVQGY